MACCFVGSANDGADSSSLEEHTHHCNVLIILAIFDSRRRCAAGLQKAYKGGKLQKLGNVQIETTLGRSRNQQSRSEWASDGGGKKASGIDEGGA